MPTDPASLLVLLVSVGLAFLLSRLVATRWRSRRKDQAEQAAREGESRQVRRARERRARN